MQETHFQLSMANIILSYFIFEKPTHNTFHQDGNIIILPIIIKTLTLITYSYDAIKSIILLIIYINHFIYCTQ